MQLYADVLINLDPTTDCRLQITNGNIEAIWLIWLITKFMWLNFGNLSKGGLLPHPK